MSAGRRSDASRGDWFDLSGRTVVITGGFGQLGRQYARAVAACGGRAALFDLPSALKPVEEVFPGLEDAVAAFAADVTDRASLEASLEELRRRFGPPWGLVNNAALDSPPNASAAENGPFETYPESSFDRVMEVNVKGAVLACQVLGGCMARNGGGSIINIGSTYGAVSPDQSLYDFRRGNGEVFYKPVAYSVSKSALLNLTRYLATYWAGRGVRVNQLTLGGVFNNQHPEFLEGYRKRTPLGRMAREDEYNGAVVFLLSDAASYMTGANLVVDGGWTAW